LTGFTIVGLIVLVITIVSVIALDSSKVCSITAGSAGENIASKFATNNPQAAVIIITTVAIS